MALVASLDNLDRKARLQRLSAASKDLAPSPVPRERKEIELLKEVAAAVGLPPDVDLQRDTSARSRVFDFLTEAIVEAIEPEIDWPTARSRLADEDLLDPKDYTYSFTPGFHDADVDKLHLFVTEREVLDTVARPTRAERLYGPVWGGKPDIDAMLLVTWFDAYALIYGGLRSRAQIHVAFAYRVYKDDVDTRDASGPLDLLKRFLGVFGADVRLRGFGTFRLLVRQVTPERLRQPRIANPRLRWTSLHGESPIGTFFLLFFAVDQVRYARAIRRHTT